MLEAASLQCVRGERVLFHDVSFALEDGALLRIAGPNGSGKTSLLRILCGLSLPSEGEVFWDGQRIREMREEFWRNLVYIGHANALKDDLTALENLEIAAALGGRPAPDGAALDALFQFDVENCASLPVRVLSQGQRRRVALARLSLATGASLWILDEPFSALDALAVRFVERLIGDQLARGGTVVYTTHQEVAIQAAVSLCIDLAS